MDECLLWSLLDILILLLVTFEFNTVKTHRVSLETLNTKSVIQLIPWLIQSVIFYS